MVETIGEIGAAHMPAAIGWAFEAGRSGYLPGRVIFSAGEDGEWRWWENGPMGSVFANRNRVSGKKTPNKSAPP